MARVFEIVPTTALIRGSDGSIEHDDRVMYAIGEDAERALEANRTAAPADGTPGTDRDRTPGIREHRGRVRACVAPQTIART